jgi:hypothetical protein
VYLDLGDCRCVTLQQREPFINSRGVAAKKAFGDTERVEQLEPDALFLIERLYNEGSQRIEASGRVATLGQFGRDRKDQWLDTQ